MVLNNSHVQGIFKYSDDIEFEKDDFVVEGNCIYICTSSEPIKRKRPSKNPDYYTAYPGDKITTAEEYYNYLNTRESGEDKYISAYALCDILENMYFGFGDNGLITDHVIYNPAEGIDYSIRSVKEILDNYTPNILNRILQTDNLNNGYVKISRSIKEISDILQEDYNSEIFESDVVILRQYTYLDSTIDTKFRVQELIDPERNKMYFRFSKGELIDGVTSFNSASSWKNIYSNDEETRNKLNTIEDYYRTKVTEVQNLYNRLKGKYCYRNVEIENPSSTISLTPGGTKDIKSIESFETKSCFLDIIIKSPINGAENIYKNYSVTIDTKDIVDSINNTEIYQLNDGLSLTGTYSRDENGYETIELSTNPSTCIIKDIYYRDYTLGHIHEWRLLTEESTPATCTNEGWGVYICDFCGEVKEEVLSKLQHTMEMHPEVHPTCTEPGNYLYYTCINEEPNVYYKNEEGTATYTGYYDGNDPVNWVSDSNQHNFSPISTSIAPTCTENGKELHECINCGYIEETVVPKLGHDLENIPRVEPPTCGDNGNIEYWRCTRCGKYFSDPLGNQEITLDDTIILPSGDHTDPGTLVSIIQPSTYTDDSDSHTGLGLYECSVCGHYIEKTIEKKMHVLVTDNTVDSKYIYIRHDATCTEPGYEEGWCEECNERRRNILSEPLGHYVDHESGEYTSPDCHHINQGTLEGYGFWRGKCTRCSENNVIEYDLNNPPQHIIDTSLSQYRPSKCNRSAYWVGTCTTCGLPNVSIDDNNHKEIGHIDKNEDDWCDECSTRLYIRSHEN